MRISNMIKWIEDKTLAATPVVVNSIHKAAKATAKATAPKPAPVKPKAKRAAKKAAPRKSTKR